ncbi:MAG TPA: LPD38 domain-containing protein [Gemmataceae bacterium]|nr:LPD38 domain-containing protein [Gemmataceae bacterium]
MACRTPWQEEQIRLRQAKEAEQRAVEQKAAEEKAQAAVRAEKAKAARAAERAAAKHRAGLKATAEAKNAEATLRSWVAGESAGRLRLTDLSRNLNKFEERDQLERYLREKKLGLDTLAADAEAAGLIRVGPGEHAEDVMWEALKEDAKIGESEHAAAELEFLERDAREREAHEAREAARNEQLAEFEYQEWKIKKEIADEKKTGLGGRGRLERLNDKLSQVEHEISKLKRGPVEYTAGDDDIPFAGGPAAPPRPGATPPTFDLVTPARLNAEVNAEFGRLTGVRDYRGEPKLPGGADARADLTQRATTTSKQADQDPFVTLEEAAHHLAYANGKGIETDPAKLPAGVPEGLAELNAVFGRAYKKPRTNVVEGYASWVKLRAAGMDGKLKGNAKAAAEWAEKWTRDNGLMGPIDAVTPLFTKFHAQSPTERAQAYGSSTGKPVVADRTPGEIAASARDRFLDDVDNDLHPAERLEAAVRAAGGRVDPDKAPSTILAAARTGDAAAKAAAWARDGVPVMTEDGRLQKHGPSVAEIEAGGRPEWLARGPDGSASKAGAYHTARGIVSMRENAYRFRDAAYAELKRYEAARDAATGALRESLTKSVARVRRAYQRTLKETEPMIDRVTEEMYQDYKAALAEWRADPTFGPWAEEFSKKQTAGFDALLDFMASIGEKTADEVKRLRSLYPDYTPTERVGAADEGWNVKVPGKKGEKAPNLSRKATGSGEAIVDPRLVYNQRLLKFAEVYNRNRAFRAFYELALQPGAGPFLQVYEREAGTRTERGLEASETLRAAGVRAEDIPAALRHMEVGDAEVYFRREPWPDDGRKPSLEGKIDGVLTSLRVGDRALYDLATNQQVDAHQTARLVRAVANLEVFGVQPVKAQANLVRTLATAANAGFQVHNVLPFRDPLTFWRNTIDRASVRELPVEYWKTYGRLLRQFTGNLGVWTKANAPGVVTRLLGVKGTGPDPAREDPLWRAFVDARGDQLKQFAFERDNPTKAYNGIETAPTARSLVKDFLNFMGAGELAPRFLEWKNKAKQITGKSVAELRAEYADYYASLKAGRKPKAPLTPGQEALLLNAAWEVTSPFPRQGTVTRQFNQITPFFGPAVSGVSKAIRNWKDNPKGALLALGALAAARTLHWLLVKDEPWYGELSAHDKYNNFVVPTPMGPRRIPGPRDLDVAVGGSLVGMLDMADKKDPRFRQLLEQSVEAVLPPGVGPAVGDAVKGDVGMGLARAVAFPAGPVGTVAAEMMMNKDWTGKPILPRRDEGKTTGLEQFRDHYGPYALKQLTGGRGELSLSGAGLNPVSRVGNLRASVDDLYERVRELEVEKAAAQRAGRRFPREAELNRLESARKQIEALAREGRGERKVGTRVVTGDRPDGDARQEIQLRQAEIAKRALGK